ncbi:MAG: hypothetical protein KJN95_10115 [Gammaproteobacteria bacterium]|nr:hypothetical protein [Gammaproteobacteria bacterium]
MLNRRFKASTFSLLLVLVCAMFAPRQVDGQVIIVKSSDNSYFDQTISTLKKHVDPATRIRVLRAAELGDRLASTDRGDVFIALGQLAVEAVTQLDAEANSINAYLTLEQYQELNLNHHLTIVLDQPMHRYLAFCKLMLDIESIGVIDANRIDPNHYRTQTLDQFKLQLNQYHVDKTNKLLPVLRNLLSQNDVLLMLPRQSIYNRDTLKGVLLTSYRKRKPAISYSPAHVKSGAVASIFSSPVDIGRHLALLLNQKLNKQIHDTPPLQFARFYTITTNLRVAHALGIELPEEGELRSRIDELQP